MAKAFTVNSKDGISWYCERQGSGPVLVLVPSGEGDCTSFSKTADSLASSFTVITFDMPGMSRTSAPRSCYQNVKAQLLADQIIGLMDELAIPEATFYGCSSGAGAVLALIRDHPTRVSSGIVHEVPFEVIPEVDALTKLSDEDAVAACRHVFSSVINEDVAAYNALGAEYHARLDKNFVTWVRNYIKSIAGGLKFEEKDLKKRPLTWTIGSLNPAGMFFENVKIATRFGLEIGLLPTRHFPQISIPEKFAEHIREAAMKYL